MFGKPPLDTLLHYGVARKSGRYPWGSGEDPHQRDGVFGFLAEYESYKAKGMGEREITEKMGMNSKQLRDNIMYARAEQKAYNSEQARALKDSGMTNVAIGDKLGVSEATVRNYLSDKTPAEKSAKVQLDNINEAIKAGVDKTGYLDVGVGVERQLGVSRTKFNAVVNKMAQDEGYNIHEVHVKRLSDPTKYTTIKVLTKETDGSVVHKNSDKIAHLDHFSNDKGQTLTRLTTPVMMDLKRIKVRYAEDGGADKDGLIELRRGVDDLDLGNSKYAQVRIGAGENLYLKGMAAYSDDKFPPGVDIIFNTNKGKGVPVEKVLKEMKGHPKDISDPSILFGSSVYKQKGALNIVNEQGDWDTWSTKMSSQFLSKQPLNLIKDRLDDTYSSLRKEYDEINSMTNPLVKKYLMESYIEGLDAKANHLKAKGLPRTKSHVLLPFPDMKPNEIYAPSMYKDGERVVLVRHPHGGIFEIPELVVNNKHAGARKMLGNAPDAVGIHPSVAGKLSGADFDGDTALVIPNNNRMIKSMRSLKELNGFEPTHIYKVGPDSPVNIHKLDPKTGKMVNTGKTIAKDYQQIQMGIVSNLITDMTIKDASWSEIARAVKHSMVVIDAEKHNLDYKQSARDNGISALIKKYQSHTNPDTGKPSRSASTLISRSKQKIDIEEGNKVRSLHKVGTLDGKPSKKAEPLSIPEISAKLKISEKLVSEYVKNPSLQFDPARYSSGTAKEELYANYIRGIQTIKNEATKSYSSITPPKYSADAAKIYAPELKSINEKLNTALLNAPKERKAQALANTYFYDNFQKDMTKDEIKKVKKNALAKAREEASAKKTMIKLTEMEWEAIQAGAVSNTKLMDVLKNADMDIVRKLAAPRELKLNSAKVTRAKLLLDKGYTYAEVANTLGVSSTTLREELGLRKTKEIPDDNAK